MQVKSTTALLLGGLAPAALSFMIVPEIAPADEALFSILPIEVAAEAEAQTLDIPCAGCPVILEGQLTTEPENHLELTFRVDHAAGIDRLLVNSFELYPNADPFGGSLVAPQVVDVEMRDRRGMMHHHHDHHKDKESSPEVPLGYRIDVYAIAKIDTKERTEAPGQPKCENLWCSVKEMLSKGLGMFKKPCPGMMKHGSHHGAGQPKPEKEMSEDVGHVDIPGHGHPHHHHSHHGHHDFKEAHGHHRFFGMLAGVIRHVLLPVLIGIVAGVSFSLIGMVVISSVLCLVRFVRGKKATGAGCPFHRRMCRNKASEAEIVVVEEEKSGLIANQEHQDPPPRYEEDTAHQS